MECGDQCVMTIGITRTQLWSADKWDTMDVSAYSLGGCKACCFPASIALLRHKVISNDSFFYHLDDVACEGHEATLSECEHAGLGVHDCPVRYEEAGVVCSSK